jgi:hypothetical protein
MKGEIKDLKGKVKESRLKKLKEGFLKDLSKLKYSNKRDFSTLGQGLSFSDSFNHLEIESVTGFEEHSKDLCYKLGISPNTFEPSEKEFVSQTVYSKEMSLGKFTLGISEKKLLSMKGVKKIKESYGDRFEYKENLKLVPGEIELPLEYWMELDDNKNLERITIYVKPSKNCDMYIFLNGLINSHLENKFNVKLVQTNLESYGKLYRISSKAYIGKYHMLRSNVNHTKEKECTMEFKLQKNSKDDVELRKSMEFRSKIKKYF